jgi:hypothetical protein
MTKRTRTRRDPTRTYIDEEAKRLNARMVERMKWFLAEGSTEDEPAYVQAVKDSIPNVRRRIQVSQNRRDLGHPSPGKG